MYYKNDGVVKILGEEFVGQDGTSLSEKELVECNRNWIVKTHQLASNGNASIYLVRDGRDSLVSFAHHELRMHGLSRGAENWQQQFDLKLIELMNRKSSAGNWGTNVCSWLDNHISTDQCNTIVRYEDLIVNPVDVVSTALKAVGYKHERIRGMEAPELRELQLKDTLFFRKGTTGQYLEEMSPELQEVFWSKAK